MLAATILVTTTATSLYNLLRDAANDSAASGSAAGTTRYDRPQEGFAEIRIQGDTTGTDTVYIGDQAVSSTNYGAKIVNNAGGTDFVEFGHDVCELNTRTIFLVASANTPLVHIWLR